VHLRAHRENTIAVTGPLWFIYNTAKRVMPVYTNPQKLPQNGVLELRQQAGRWLKELRESRHLSQRGLADRVGAEYYTFISQIEAGRGRIPPDRYEAWAAALGVEPTAFVQTLLRYYDPLTHAIVFGDV
jgi:DNA-binding XRE family transcriptional regulator